MRRRINTAGFNTLQRFRPQYNNLRRVKRRVRQVANPFALPNHQFEKRFRLKKYLAVKLTKVLSPFLTGKRQHALKKWLKVLMALQVFAHGSYQKVVGDSVWTFASQASVSRSVSEVTQVLLQIKNSFIAFPQTKDMRQQVSAKFQEHCHFPGVLANMDCVLVPIFRPSQAEGAFFCRKKFPALNCQVTADMDYLISSICIYPGSYTDNSIWNSSFLKKYMEGLRRNQSITLDEGKFYIIADSGYNPSKILLTKIKNAPSGSMEAFFNKVLGHVRSWIEQTYGQWLNTWRVVGKEKRLHYLVQKARDIVVATAVLHNFELRKGVPIAANSPDVIEILDTEDCSIADGIKEACEIIVYYL